MIRIIKHCHKGSKKQMDCDFAVLSIPFYTYQDDWEGDNEILYVTKLNLPLKRFPQPAVKTIKPNLYQVIIMILMAS